MTRTAVVLFNLGGPDKRESIKPFLMNFFNDKAIIGAPQPIRGLIARYIAWKRTRGAAGKSYRMLGYQSPLLKNTEGQAAALQDQLGDAYRVYVCMRYWHPMADQVAAQVLADGCDRVILLPLYPQFSTTTTGSSFADWTRAAQKVGLDVPSSLICCYPDHPGFVSASAARIGQAYASLSAQTGRAPRLLFSAHGLPEKIIAGGDPYQSQCEQSAARIAAALNIPNLDWQICYQSRVGPLKWIGPSTEQALQQAAADQVPVVVYPHAFVSEHVETLVEIEHEYRDLARDLGVPGFARAETVMTHPDFIQGLADLVRRAQMGIAPGGPCPCTAKHVRCLYQKQGDQAC